MNMELAPTQPRIEAEGFLLRPLRLSDAGLIALYTGDERVARMTRTIPHPLPPGVAEALGISRWTVYARSDRALKAMRAALEAEARPPAMPVHVRQESLR